MTEELAQRPTSSIEVTENAKGERTLAVKLYPQDGIETPESRWAAMVSLREMFVLLRATFKAPTTTEDEQDLAKQLAASIEAAKK